MRRSKPPRQSTSETEVDALRKLSTTYYAPNTSRASIESAETEEPQKPRRRKRIIASLLLVVFLIPIILFGTLLVWNYNNFSSASQKLFDSSNPLELLSSTSLQQTNDRTNVLLVGYSVDSPDHPGATLTDSILLLSIDNRDKSGFMLSIPRDLYVNIDNYGLAKINETYQAGERNNFSQAGYPSGGIGLLRKVVSESLGVTIHYHMIINYATVRETVDALGGITVTIDSSDERGLYDPNFQPHEGGALKLPNGTQTIDGETALKLTRARNETNNGYGFPLSDFTRTEHQQLVLQGITNELSWTLLLDPRTNGKIFDAIGNNIQTDVTLSEVIPLTRLIVAAQADTLESLTLRDINDTNLLASYTTPSGQSALIPRAGVTNFSEIQSALRTLTDSPDID